MQNKSEFQLSSGSASAKGIKFQYTAENVELQFFFCHAVGLNGKMKRKEEWVRISKRSGYRRTVGEYEWV